MALSATVAVDEAITKIAAMARFGLHQPGAILLAGTRFLSINRSPTLTSLTRSIKPRWRI